LRSTIGNVKALDTTTNTSSPRVLRTLNSLRVIDHAWAVNAFTATDAMRATGLTRATVIGVCDELVAAGLLEQLRDARAAGDYVKGRPARRYSLRSNAAVVVGVDAGYDRMSATVADLRGRALGSASVHIPARTPQSVGRLADSQMRRALATRVVDDALGAARADTTRVLSLTVGVPAPVDAHGNSPVYTDGFWQLMNPGLRELFSQTAPIVTVENDANLVAIAERASPSGRGVDSFITLLADEGIGAGIMVDGRLIRGRRGGAGEMRFLDHVTGVGSSNGLALCARQWGAEAIRSGALPRHSALDALAPETLTESDIHHAAELGDIAASAILDRLAARLARVCIVLGDLLDVDRIVVGGSVVESMPQVIVRARTLLGASADPTAPELTASTLGGNAVGRGAVEHALTLVKERALDLFPPAVSASPEAGWPSRTASARSGW
jgi:predicted NBD/HSP70 family sugar kinase